MPLLLSPSMQKFAQDQIKQGYHDSVEGVIDDLLVQATTPACFQSIRPVNSEPFTLRLDLVR